MEESAIASSRESNIYERKLIPTFVKGVDQRTLKLGSTAGICAGDVSVWKEERKALGEHPVCSLKNLLK